LTDLARHQSLNQLNSRRRVLGRLREVAGDHGFADQQRDDRCQIIGERRQPFVVEAVGDLADFVQQIRQRQPAGRTHLGRDGVLDDGRGGCHLVKIVQQTVDGAGLLVRIGDVATHQFGCPPHRISTDVLTQLTDQLRTQQLSLLGTLLLDPLRVTVGLGPQQFTDALGI